MKFLSKNEIIFVVIILLAGAGLFLFQSNMFQQIGTGYGESSSEENSTTPEEPVMLGQIIFFGQIIREFPLDTEATFRLPERPGMVFEIRENTVAIIESDCPDQVCVGMGFLGRFNPMSVCVPNGIILTMVAQED